MADDRLQPLLPQVEVGRRFRTSRKVRLGDVNPAGRLRLDGLLRYAQDVSDDDTTDAGLATEPSWVARRTVVDVLEPAVLGEQLSFTTFCGGLGRRWAERRHTIVGSDSARYEVSTLWICVDAISGRPERLTEQFLALYGPAAAGRTVGARLTLPKAPGLNGDAASLQTFEWPLRVVDFDVYDHVNNAAYGAVVEERLQHDDQPVPFRWTMEYQAGITPRPSVTVSEDESAGRRLLWWVLGDGAAAVASLQPLPSGLYDASVAEAVSVPSAPSSGETGSPLNTAER